jgi:peptide/nickel transport system substrate-binding protein
MDVTRKAGTAAIAACAVVSLFMVVARSTTSDAVALKVTTSSPASYAQLTAQDLPNLWQPSPVGIVEVEKSVKGMEAPNPLGDFNPEYITGNPGGSVLTVPDPPGTFPTSVFPFSSGAQCATTNVDYWDLQARPGYWFGLGNSIALQPSLSPLNAPILTASGANTDVTITTRGWEWSNGTGGTHTMDAQDVAFWVNMDKAQRGAGENSACGFAPGLGFPDQVLDVSYPGGLAGNTIKITFAGHPSAVWLEDNELSQIVPLAPAWDTTNGSNNAGCSTESFASVTESGSDACSNVFNYLSGLQINDAIWDWADGPYRQQSAGYSGAAPDGTNVQVCNTSYSGPVTDHCHAVKTIDYVPFTNTAAETSALEANQLDLGYVDPSDVTASPGPGRAGSNIIAGLKKSYQALGNVSWGASDWVVNYDNAQSSYQTAGPLPAWANELNNEYFRGALESSIDQPGIISHVLNGYGFEAFSAIPTYPKNSFSSGITNPYPYSPATAKALMKKNGWNMSSFPAVCAKGGTDGCGTASFPIAQGSTAVIQLLAPSGDPSVTTQIDDEVAEIKAGSDIEVQPNFEGAANDVQNACLAGASLWELCALGPRVYSPDIYPSGEELFTAGASANLGGYNSTAMSSLVQATTSGGSLGLNAAPPGPTPTCAGEGACDITSVSPRAICLSVAACPPGGTSVTTVSVKGFMNGKLAAPGVRVTVHFLSSSTPSRSGAWCQGANGTKMSGVTNSHGIFQFNYTSAGPGGSPPIASFCIMKASIGKASIYGVIDQTNDPNTWLVKAGPRNVSRISLPSQSAGLLMTVLNAVRAPVFGDPTTFYYSMVPSTPGSCGSIAPQPKKTSRPHGRASILYRPSTVIGTCTLIGEEVDTAAISNKVVVHQQKPPRRR